MATAPDPTAQMERLLAVLGDFTDHVSSMASIHVQRDIAKKHLARQEAEFLKWRKQHESFPPLAEQQEKTRTTAQKEFDELDKKLKQHVKSRDQLAKAIAVSVISNQSEGGGESARVHALENQLETTRTGIQRLRADVNQGSSEYGQIHAVQRDCKKNKDRIADMDIKLGRLMATPDRLPVAPPAENSTINLEKQLSKLQEKLSLLQDRVDDIPNLKLDLSKSKQEVRDLNSLVNVQVGGLRELKDTVNGQVDSLRELRGTAADLKGTFEELKDTVVQLKGTVVGEADEKGLIDVIASVEEDLEKYRAAMTTMNEELNGFHDKLHKFGGNIATIERGTSRRQTPQLVAPMTKYDDSEIRSGLEAIKAEMTDFQNDLTTHRREQEDKDELVAADIDAINTSASKLDDTVRTNRDDLEATIARINASISTLQARASTPVAVVNPPTPATLTNSATKFDDAINKKFQDTLMQHRQALERHRENIVALERAYQHLDDRFNNLTTDRLAQNMVHQMSEMYPYAANVQAEIDLAKKRDEQLRQSFTGLFARVAQLDKLISDTPLSISPDQFNAFHKRLDTLAAEIENMRMQANTKHEDLHNRINGVDWSLQKQTPRLRDWIASLRKDLGALSSHVDEWGSKAAADLGNVGMQVNRLNEHCGLVFDNPQGDGALVATMQQKLAVAAAPDDDGMVGAPTVAADGMPKAGEDDVPRPGMVRTLLTKRKRRTIESSEEEDVGESQDKRRSGE